MAKNKFNTKAFLEELVFLSKLNKIASGSYKCPKCGYDPHDSEDSQTPYCPKCGESMNNNQGYETRQNS